MPKGKSFLSANEKTPSGDVKRHLRIVITDPDPKMRQVVVTVRSMNNHADSTCIIEQGEHEFIKHRSFIDFSRTTTMSFTEIYNGIKKGLLIDKGDISKELLHKIQAAAKKSARISHSIKEMFEYF